MFRFFKKLLASCAKKEDWTYTAGDLLDLLHVLLVWSVIRQGVPLSLVLVVLHLIDDLKDNCHTEKLKNAANFEKNLRVCCFIFIPGLEATAGLHGLMDKT